MDRTVVAELYVRMRIKKVMAMGSAAKQKVDPAPESSRARKGTSGQ